MAGFSGLIKKYPGFSTLLALEFLLLLIISYQVKVDERLTLLEKVGLMIFGPVQQLNHRVVGSVSKTVEEKRTHEALTAENKQLREALISFNRLKTNYIEAEMENDRFRNLLSLPQEEEWEYVHAEVIGRTHRRNDYMITINKGSEHGVLPDQGVIGPDGVVGVVWEVSGGYAKIMTLNNPSAVVASLLQNSRYQESYVVGNGGVEARLENFPNFEAIAGGDLVLTSGLDRIFPKGHHIGRVSVASASQEMFQRALINLSTDFTRLELVTVVIPACDIEVDHEVE